MRTDERRITCLDVARAFGVEASDELMWSLGANVRERWLGLYPEMSYELREKKRGPGSHQMATYPHWFWPVIVEEIKRLDYGPKRQLDLGL